MTIGIQPVRGNWEIRQVATLSTATFGQFAPVTYGGARTLIEATSASTFILGVANHSSVNSLPAGQVSVSIPRDFSAVARTFVGTGVASSALSSGQGYNIKKSGNTLMLDVASQASVVLEISDPANFDSATSLIDVVFVTTRIAQPSYSSASIF